MHDHDHAAQQLLVMVRPVLGSSSSCISCYQ